MTSRKLNAALPLGKRLGSVDPSALLQERVAMVLGTQLGQVPWRPDFGCDLEAFVGEAATEARLSELRDRIETAIATALPDVDLLECTLRIVPKAGMSPDWRAHNIPLAETAMLALGADAGILVTLDLRGPAGSGTVTTELNL